VLNNPKVREALMGGAATANSKVRQQIEAFVQTEVAKATGPLFARIRELEARVDQLESQSGKRPARPSASAGNHFDV
jgi:hypothetical protein